MATTSSDRQGPTELSERNRRLIDHILGDGAHKGFADLATILETFMEAARADAAKPPQGDVGADSGLAAADDNHKALVEALQKIIDMNVQYAIDRWGDASKAESMACVTTARQAIAASTKAPRP